jgi:hypothetical protein
MCYLPSLDKTLLLTADLSTQWKESTFFGALYDIGVFAKRKGNAPLIVSVSWIFATQDASDFK